LEIAGNLFVNPVGFSSDPTHTFQLHLESVLSPNKFALNICALYLFFKWGMVGNAILGLFVYIKCWFGIWIIGAPTALLSEV